jgi:hypothetical protein
MQNFFEKQSTVILQDTVPHFSGATVTAGTEQNGSKDGKGLRLVPPPSTHPPTDPRIASKIRLVESMQHTGQNFRRSLNSNYFLQDQASYLAIACKSMLGMKNFCTL